MKSVQGHLGGNIETAKSLARQFKNQSAAGNVSSKLAAKVNGVKQQIHGVNEMGRLKVNQPVTGLKRIVPRRNQKQLNGILNGINKNTNGFGGDLLLRR